jgi:hypothetical protein
MTRLILPALMLALSVLTLHAQSTLLSTDRSGYTTGIDGSSTLNTYTDRYGNTTGWIGGKYISTLLSKSVYLLSSPQRTRDRVSIGHKGVSLRKKIYGAGWSISQLTDYKSRGAVFFEACPTTPLLSRNLLMGPTSSCREAR